MLSRTSENIIFRFDASSQIGIGHAFRCMALLERFSLHEKLCCIVIARSLPRFIVEKLTALKAVVHLLSGKECLASELGKIKDYIIQYQAKAMVLDGYHFDSQYRQSLSAFNIKIIAFDDTNDLANLFCDVIINALPFSDALGYEKSASQALHLLGLEHSIIREEFLKLKKQPFINRQKLLINFGGSDVANLTFPLISELLIKQIIDDPKHIIVVTGGAYSETEKMDLLAARGGFQHIHHCQNMAEVLSQCKLVICAPGSIVYELAYCGVPSIFLTVADNQLLSAQAHQHLGWCKVENGLEKEAINKALRHLSQLWNAPLELTTMSEIAAKLIDGEGVKRICSVIKELLR